MVEIRSLQTILTAENIPLELELSGMCSRLIAFIIDFFLMGLVIISFIGMENFFLKTNTEAIKTIVPLTLFLVFFGYHLLQEWLMSGQTVGKKIFNIRVVREDGQPIGFWESLGRNLLRIVDVYFFALGILVMTISKREKRLGDYLVGTVVIQDQLIRLQFIESANQQKSHTIVPPIVDTEQEHLISTLATLISEEEKALLGSFATRADTMSLKQVQEWNYWFSTYLNDRFTLPANLEQMTTLQQQTIIFGLITTLS